MQLLSKQLYPDEGQIVVRHDQSVAVARQAMPATSRGRTVKEFFAAQLDDPSLPDHELEAKMSRALQDVLLEAPGERLVKSFSGGQQARLLLAAALIRNPSILLMDEPTNNLDADGEFAVAFVFSWRCRDRDDLGQPKRACRHLRMPASMPLLGHELVCRGRSLGRDLAPRG